MCSTLLLPLFGEKTRKATTIPLLKLFSSSFFVSRSFVYEERLANAEEENKRRNDDDDDEIDDAVIKVARAFPSSFLSSSLSLSLSLGVSFPRL